LVIILARGSGYSPALASSLVSIIMTIPCDACGTLNHSEFVYRTDNGNFCDAECAKKPTPFNGWTEDAPQVADLTSRKYHQLFLNWEKTARKE
jgi:hypothetical protein